MQIICKWAAALLVLGTACAPAMAAKAQLPLDQGAMLILEYYAKTAKAEWQHEGQRTKLALAPSLNALLASADEVFAIGKPAPGKPQNFALVVRVPSRPTSPQGYCGAGHEDYLLLLAIKAGKLVMRDKLRLQSCLDNVALISDQGDDPHDALIPLQWPYLVRFMAISGSDTGIRVYTVRVEQGRLRVQSTSA